MNWNDMEANSEGRMFLRRNLQCARRRTCASFRTDLLESWCEFVEGMIKPFDMVYSPRIETLLLLQATKLQLLRARWVIYKSYCERYKFNVYPLTDPLFQEFLKDIA